MYLRFMDWVRHGGSTAFETKSSYCRVARKGLPCYTAVARLGFKRRATAVLKWNLIRSIEFGTAVARRLKQALDLVPGQLISSCYLYSPSQCSELDSLSTIKHSNFQIILAHHEVFCSTFCSTVSEKGCFIAPCKGIQIPESRNFLLVESGILGFGIRNPTYYRSTPD